MNASPVTGASRSGARRAEVRRARDRGRGPRASATAIARRSSEVEFTIARGEIFGFLGPNGGGKSTLFRLLSTLMPIQSGNARILGCDLRGGHPGATAQDRRGLPEPEPRRQADRGREPVPSMATSTASRGARLQGARAERCWRGWTSSDRAGDLVETLSGGLRRRVELAKALLHQPELLLLDEPSTGLDPAARREFFNLLARLRESDGVTIVLTTHYMEEAERCDRIGDPRSGPPGRARPAGRTQAAGRRRRDGDKRRRRPRRWRARSPSGSRSARRWSTGRSGSSGRADTNWWGGWSTNSAARSNR